MCWEEGWSASFKKDSVLTTLAGGPWEGVTLTVLKVGSCGWLRDLAIKKASYRLNRPNHFWSSYSILESVEEDGRWDVDLTDLSSLTSSELVAFLSSVFFFSAGCPLKPNSALAIHDPHYRHVPGPQGWDWEWQKMADPWMELKTWFLASPSLIYKTGWTARLIVQESEVYNAGNQSLDFSTQGSLPFFLVTTACTDAMQIKTSHHWQEEDIIVYTIPRRHNSLHNTKSLKIYNSEAKFRVHWTCAKRKRCYDITLSRVHSTGTGRPVETQTSFSDIWQAGMCKPD